MSMLIVRLLFVVAQLVHAPRQQVLLLYVQMDVVVNSQRVRMPRSMKNRLQWVRLPRLLLLQRVRMHVTQWLEAPREVGDLGRRLALHRLSKH
jgi:hypothetical protein